MQTRIDSTKSQFTIKMLSAIEEVKEKYSRIGLNDTISIVHGQKTNNDLFTEKIQSCKQLLGIGGTSMQSDTLIKIDALKIKFNQISVDELKRNNSRRVDLSLDNIKRTFDELDVKGCNDILHSLELNDFEWLRNHDAIADGTAKLERVLVRCTLRHVRGYDRFAQLTTLVDKFASSRKNEVSTELKQFSATYRLNTKLKTFIRVIERLCTHNSTKAKCDCFATIKARNQLADMVLGYYEEKNMLAIVQLKQFGLVFKIFSTLNKTLKICNNSFNKSIIAPLRHNASTYRGLNMLTERVRDTQRYSLKVGLTQLVHHMKGTSKESDKLDGVKQSLNGTITGVTKSLLIPVNHAHNRQKYPINRKSLGGSEGKKPQSFLKTVQSSDLKLSNAEDVQYTITIAEQAKRCMGDAMQHFQMTDTVVSETSYRERRTPDCKEREQMLNLIESRIIQNKSEVKAQDEAGEGVANSLREMHKNDSMSKIDMNSCLKESVPDSDFIKYCEMVFNSKKINYNFSLDNIDVFRNSRQRTENDMDRGENNSFNENSPNLRDIDQWMIFAKKLNNSYELKDQTLDFLKSVDMDAKQRNSYKDQYSDFSLQKKESIKLIGEASPIRIDAEQNALMDTYELKDSMAQLMDLQIDQAMKTFIPAIVAKNSFDALKDRRELTAIKEESTLIDKSHCTLSKNYSYTIESRDMHNSFRKPCDILNSNLHAEPAKKTQSKQSLKIRITPRNSEAKKDSSHGSEIIKHIDSLKNDFVGDDKLERQSCASSNSSEINNTNPENKYRITPRAIQSTTNKPQHTKLIDNKRPSLQDRLHSTINYTEKRRPASNARPSSNFDLKKWSENFKSTTTQYKNSCNQAANTRKVSKDPRTCKNAQVNGSNAGLARLKTDHLDAKPLPRTFSKTLRGKLQHQSFVTPASNYSKANVRPLSNLKRVKSGEDAHKTEPNVVREHTKTKAQTEHSNNKKLQPASRLSPTPQFHNGKLFGFDKRRTVSYSRAKNFVDGNKKIAFENNIAKYFPKVVESRPMGNDKSSSFNVSRSAIKPRALLNRNNTSVGNDPLILTRAHSVQYKNSQKSFTSTSMVVNKENGMSYNVDARREANLTHKYIKASSSDISFKNRPTKSWADSIKQERPRALQRKADSRFFEVS